MGVTLLGAAGEVKESYEISNSLRFNDDDSASLSFTPSGNPTDADKFTISCWIKLGNIGVNNAKIYDTGGSDDNNRFALQFQGTNSTLMTSNNSGVSIITSQVLRDPSAWYHVVAAIDSQNSTTNNKHIIYVNGVQADIGTNNLGSTSQVGAMTNGVAQYIGRNGGADNSHFDGYMTEFHFVDGQQLAPTSFGEFDDNGVWIPKRYTGTYGNNGFFLQFKQTGTSQNSSGIGADTSGNDNHFAVTNLAATDVTEDTCTNNFATLNALDHRLGSCTLSEGNCKFVGANGGSGKTVSTIGVTSGKWYAEFKVLNTHKARIGIIDQTGHDVNDAGTNDGVDYSVSDGYIYTYLNGTNNDTGNNSSSSGVDLDNPSANDIIGIALDADNEKVRFYRNGTAEGTEGDGFTPLQRTGTGETYFFHVRDGSGSGDDEPQIECNFGNAPFSISSGNTDGKYGNFEYAPPSGFYALCTKRLAEFG
jgi:hypothetical protein